MALTRQTVGVDEMGVVHPKLFGGAVHARGKASLIAADIIAKGGGGQRKRLAA